MKTLFTLFFGFLTLNLQAQIYVNLSATGANDGSSWANAYTDLQVALDVAISTDTIWVKEGTYIPTQIVDGADPNDTRNRSFHVTGKKIALYGGFVGTETSIDERNPENNGTILSGNVDLGGGASYNLYHVMVLANTESYIDRFVIRQGHAITVSSANYTFAGQPVSNSNGGGIYACFDNYLGSVVSAKLKFNNCLIANNSSKLFGGGIYITALNSGALLQLENSTLSQNSCESPTGGGGSGICAFSDWGPITVHILESTVYGNYHANSYGAALYMDGYSDGKFEIENSTFYNNTYYQIYCSSWDLYPIKVKGSIFWNYGGQAYDFYSPDPTMIVNSLGNNIFKYTPSYGVAQASDKINVTASMLNLQQFNYYGGSTPTLLPGSESIAINNGDPNDSSDAQNRSIFGIRDIGSAERIQTYFDTIQTECNTYTWMDGNTYTSDTIVNYTKYDNNYPENDSVFTLNLTLLESPFSIDSVEACDSYTWMDGNTYTSDNDTAIYILEGVGANGCDSIVKLSLKLNHQLVITDNQSACGSFTWIDGNTYTESNNIAEHIIVGGAANGCNAVIKLNLTLLPSPDVSTTVSEDTIYTNSSGLNYQWIDCNAGNMVIPGASNEYFTSSTAGTYAVIIDNGNCVDTSACISINNVGITTIKDSGAIEVYPNPTTGELYINLLTSEETTVILYNSLGEKLKSLVNHSQQVHLQIEEAPGIYYIKITNKQFTQTICIVKQ